MANPFEYLRARRQLRRQSLKLRGLEVSFHQQGAGPDFLLVASSLAMITTYMLTVEKLAQHFRVTIVEAPGSGLSTNLSEVGLTPWTFAESADFLCDVSIALGLQTPWVAGHSQSGPVVAWMLAQKPSMFAGGVLTGAAGAHPWNSLLVLFAGRVVDALLEPGLVLLGTHHVVINMFRHFRNFWFQIWNCRGSHVLHSFPDASIQVPVLLAWGRHDHEMPRVCAHRWAAKFGRPVIYFAKWASHDFVITKPAEYTQVVVAFTERMRAARGDGAG